MISLLTAILLSPPVGHSEIKLSSGIVVEANWVPGSYPGGNGSMEVVVTDNRNVRKEAVPLASDSWPDLDAPVRPAALLTPGTKTTEAVLDITLSIESGVYGYRRVQTYKVSPRDKKLLNPVGKPVEFSDFGSWRRVDPQTIEYWDAIWDDSEAHHAPHRYGLTRVSQSASGHKVLLTEKTRKSYLFTWESSLTAPTSVPSKDDPLRELGSAWTWWGEPKQQAQKEKH